MVVADERVLLRGPKVTIDGRAGVQMMSGAKCGRTRKGFVGDWKMGTDGRRTCGRETMPTMVWGELDGGRTEQRWERVGLQEAGERRRDGRFLWCGCCKLIQSSIVKKTT